MAPVWEAMQQMKEHGFSSLIVVIKDIADQVVANYLSFDRAVMIMREMIWLSIRKPRFVTPQFINRFKMNARPFWIRIAS